MMKPVTEREVHELLDQLGVSCERFEHQPVYTTEEARAVLPNAPGCATKNLFLRDDKGTRHYLVVARDDNRWISSPLPSSKLRSLSLASPERRKSYLGLEPGSVTVLAVLADDTQQVELFIDEDVAGSIAVQCHPMVNTATLVLAWSELKRLCESAGHPPRVVPIPVRS